jgi:predicted MFS family arabinose efflux permease
LTGGWLSDAYGMEATFYWMGALNAVAFFAVLLFLPEVRHAAHARTQSPSYRTLLRKPRIQGIALYRMANAVQMGLWFSFLPLLAAEVLGISKAQIGVVIAIFMLANSLVQVPFGRLADRMSRRALIVAGGYLGSLAFATVFFAEGFLHLLIIGAVTGAIGAMAMPALSALAADEGQNSGMGAVMGVINMAMSAGMMLGPVLAGVLAEIFGLRGLFIFGAVAGGIGTLLFAWLSGEHRIAAVVTPEVGERQTEVSS